MSFVVRLYNLPLSIHGSLRIPLLSTNLSSRLCAAQQTLSCSNGASCQLFTRASAAVIAARPFTPAAASYSPLQSTALRLLSPHTASHSFDAVRHATFYIKLPAKEIWKGVTSVSKFGEKKGRNRGSSRKIARDFNRGQIIGVGPVNMIWPGLNSPMVRGQEIVRQQKLSTDEERQRRLQELRDNLTQVKRRKMLPQDRGWSGVKMGGKRMGPPDPIGDERFENFESICLEYKTVTVMKSNVGRCRRASVFTVTGNRNGLVGFGLGKATKPQTAVKIAKNRAGQNLLYIPRYNNHTVMHDFFTEFGITQLFVKKMHEGYGLVCHRVLKGICEMAGIKDIHIKVEKSINVQNMTKAFFLGLIRQKTHQQLAEEKGLHLVEQRKENYHFPTVLASPQFVPVRTVHDISPEENLDFDIHVMGDRVRKDIRRFNPWTKSPGWERYLVRWEKKRNHKKSRMELIKEYGAVRSFYFDQYPECTNDYFAAGRMMRHREQPEEED